MLRQEKGGLIATSDGWKPVERGSLGICSVEISRVAISTVPSVVGRENGWNVLVDFP